MMKDEEKALKLRPLSIGSMELMQRFNCGFMDGSMNLGCIVEYIYIHTEDIETLESMSLDAFKEAVRRFKYELSPDEMQRISSLVGMQAQQVDEAAFTVEDSKKKTGGDRPDYFIQVVWAIASKTGYPLNYIKYDIPYSMILQFLMSECVANGVSCYYTHARKVDHADLERLDALFNKPVDVEE